MRYAFGDTKPAVDRLRLVHEIFSESSQPFMLEAVSERPSLAADLGCGPGYTTHLLANTLSPYHTVGLDNSDNFVRLAQTTASKTVSFHLHDVTTRPFPGAPYDLMFSRFVLTHLPGPKTVVDLWVTQLKLRGLLLAEEVEYIDTTNPVLNSYLKILQATLARQDNCLYIGSRLHRITDSASLKQRSSEVRTVTVPARRAAAMFHMNLSLWKNHDYVQRTHEQAELDELEHRLASIVSGSGDTNPVQWGLRHIVMERV